MVDQFGTYEVTFVFAGIMMCVGGTSAIIARCIHSQSEESKDDIDQSEDWVYLEFVSWEFNLSKNCLKLCLIKYDSSMRRWVPSKDQFQSENFSPTHFCPKVSQSIIWIQFKNAWVKFVGWNFFETDLYSEPGFLFLKVLLWIFFSNFCEFLVNMLRPKMKKSFFGWG